MKPAQSSWTGATGGQVRGQPLLRHRAGDVDLVLMRPSVPEAEIAEHAHADMHLVMLMSGAYVSSARDMPPVCTGQALVYNPPGVEHRDRFRSRGGLFLAISQPAASFADFLGGARPPVARRLGPDALNLGFSLLRESHRPGPDQTLVLQSLLAEILADAQPDAARRSDSPVVRRALDALHAQSPCMDIASLAAHAGVHPVYLARVFRRALGRSPGEYLRRLRALRGLDWLARGHSAASAALRSEHVDASHLGRALRREFGLKPGDLRRRRVPG